MDLFVEIGIIIVIATLITALMRLLKQPLIIGYIITGIVVSPYFLNIIKSTETISAFSQLGVALLLFLVGLHLSPRVIKEVGKISLIAGIGQVVFTASAGFLISSLLGFSAVTSFYIAIALTFSSTIIVMKLLFDKRDLEKLYGKISVGILIVQDIVAAIILMVISSSGLNAADLAIVTVFKGLILIGGLILISVYALPQISTFFAKSQEFLFLFSIAWGLGLASLFHFLGFSIEIGALIAGVTLSMSPYHYEISSKLRPLRDFFLILFFILIGSQLSFESSYVRPIVIFSLFVFIFHPVIIMIFMGLTKHNKRNSFLTGTSLAQISEFSLIVVALGINMGHITRDIGAIITMVFFITVAGSTYFIRYSKEIYSVFSGILTVFERKDAQKTKKEKILKYNAILFGYNRIGYDFLKSFKKMKKDFLVVDYDPVVIKHLIKEGIDCKYGDADDNEFLDELDLENIKLAVSTIPDFEPNSLIINKIREVNKDAIIIPISHNIGEAERLYEQGATYVLMPHFLGGKHGAMLINRYGFSKTKFRKEGKIHRKYLQHRKKIGHEHPRPEKYKWN